MKKLGWSLLFIFLLLGGIFLIKKEKVISAATFKISMTTAFISSRDCIKSTYSNEIGVIEEGNNRGERVNQYLKSAGVKPGQPWCGSFVNWTFKQCDSTFKLKGAAIASSWFPEEHTIYIRGKINKQLPNAGDVIGIYNPKNNKISHVGFLDSEENDFYICVEGNINANKSGIGGGVFKIKRIKRTIYAISSWIKI